MKAWINRWIFFISLAYHSTVAWFRLESGQLYVMRDRPLWFVREMAEGPWAEVMTNYRDATVAAAKAELQLRTEHPKGTP